MQFPGLTAASAVAATVMVFVTSGASAHVWNIGWASADGGLEFYGLSYHTSLDAGDDDFITNPAGIIVNGTNVSFDIGSVVDIPSDCSGLGGLISGTCSPEWDALGLDGALAATNYAAGGIYGKYAKATVSASALTALGIGPGANQVVLGTFGINNDWYPKAFPSSPVEIVVSEPSAVPVPATLPLLGSIFSAFAFLGWRRHRQA